jgi:hypothetical protein
MWCIHLRRSYKQEGGEQEEADEIIVGFKVFLRKIHESGYDEFFYVRIYSPDYRSKVAKALE